MVPDAATRGGASQPPEIGFVLHDRLCKRVSHNPFSTKQLAFIRVPANWVCFARRVVHSRPTGRKNWLCFARQAVWRLALFRIISPRPTHVVGGSGASLPSRRRGKQPRPGEFALICIIARALTRRSAGAPPAGDELCFAGHDQPAGIDYLLPMIAYSVVWASYRTLDFASSKIPAKQTFLLAAHGGIETFARPG